MELLECERPFVSKNILTLRNSDFRRHLADTRVDRTGDNRTGDTWKATERELFQLEPVLRIGIVRCKRRRRHANHADLNLILSIPKLLIFESRVCRGIPSLAAAPDGPAIRPSVSAKAASIIRLS